MFMADLHMGCLVPRLGSTFDVQADWSKCFVYMGASQMFYDTKGGEFANLEHGEYRITTRSPLFVLAMNSFAVFLVLLTRLTRVTWERIELPQYPSKRWLASTGTAQQAGFCEE
jgi:hypothetical protein